MAEASTYRRNPRLPDCIVSDHRNLDALDAQLQSASKDGNKVQLKMVVDAIYITQLLRVENDLTILLPEMANQLGDSASSVVEEATNMGKQQMKVLAKMEKASASEQAKLATEACKAAVEYFQLLEEKALPMLQTNLAHAQMLALEKQRCGHMYAAALKPSA